MMSALGLQLTQSPQWTAEQDHQFLLKQLGISSLRPGVDGMNPKSPNFANTDEAKASPYHRLPDLMTLNNGSKVQTRSDWGRRRAEIVELLDREIYGRTPKNLPKVKWEVTSEKAEKVGEIDVNTSQLVGHVDNRRYPEIKVDIKATLTLPAVSTRKVPVIIEFGFPGFSPNRQFGGGTGPTWQQMVIAKGWGYAILDPTSVQADNGGGLRQGIIGLVNKGQPRKPEDWGALKAWGWGASKVLDYLQTNKAVNSRKVGIEGLSRYGKATVVTMAYDKRFAIALVGSSGQGGVKLWRRNFGETVENVASSGGYHWMGDNYVKYAGPLTPDDMPVDAHELVAMCAPRPVFVGVGSLNVEGIWIDPVGTFKATSLASPAWQLLGKKGLGTTDMPSEGTPLVAGDLAFSQHHGGHTNGPNWPIFIKFASRYLD